MLSGQDAMNVMFMQKSYFYIYIESGYYEVSNGAVFVHICCFVCLF